MTKENLLNKYQFTFTLIEYENEEKRPSCKVNLINEKIEYSKTIYRSKFNKSEYFKFLKRNTLKDEINDISQQEFAKRNFLFTFFKGQDITEFQAFSANFDYESWFNLLS